MITKLNSIDNGKFISIETKCNIFLHVFLFGQNIILSTKYKIQIVFQVTMSSSFLTLLVLSVVIFIVAEITNGMNIDQQKITKLKENIDTPDVQIKIYGKINSDAERNLEVIDEVLEHLLEDEEHETHSELDEEPLKEGPQKFFISTKTKTLKTTMTSTHSITSYHTCYKGKWLISATTKKAANLIQDIFILII